MSDLTFLLLQIALFIQAVAITFLGLSNLRQAKRVSRLESTRIALGDIPPTRRGGTSK